jgi:hypothetical protein
MVQPLRRQGHETLIKLYHMIQQSAYSTILTVALIIIVHGSKQIGKWKNKLLYIQTMKDELSTHTRHGENLNAHDLMKEVNTKGCILCGSNYVAF